MKNVIADFSHKDCDTLRVKGLTQWDYGQTLEIRLDNMPETFEAHFSAQNMDEALVVEAISVDGSAIIPIPNIITTQSKEATCYLYYEDETSGETHKTIILLIKPRKKPTDYVYTETEVFNYRIFKKELEAKIAKAGAVKTVNGNEPDENGNVEIELLNSFSGEWDALKNKPFGKEEKLIISFEQKDATIPFHPMSESYYAEFEIGDTTVLEIGKSYKTILNIGDESYEDYIRVNEGGYIEATLPCRIERSEDALISIMLDSDVGVVTIQLQIYDTMVETLNKEFLPEHLQFGKDVTPIHNINEYAWFSKMVGAGFIYAEFDLFHDEPMVSGKDYDVTILCEGIERSYTLNTNADGPSDSFVEFFINGNNTVDCMLYGEGFGITESGEHNVTIKVVGKSVKTLDEEYIPNNVPKVQHAEVGQIVVVKAVDENGKPTEWECSSGSSDSSDSSGSSVVYASELIEEKRVYVAGQYEYFDAVDIANLPIGTTVMIRDVDTHLYYNYDNIEDDVYANDKFYTITRAKDSLHISTPTRYWYYDLDEEGHLDPNRKGRIVYALE